MADPGVTAFFATVPAPTRERLLELRTLICATAAATAGVGQLTETLKWGEPSYAPVRPRVGSSVRLQARGDGAVALMFICHTNLVGDFRERYPDGLTFEGNRAIVLAPGAVLPYAELGHCIAMALTWHLNKR